MKTERVIATILYAISMLELFKQRHKLIDAMEALLSGEGIEGFKFREDLNPENLNTEN